MWYNQIEKRVGGRTSSSEGVSMTKNSAAGAIGPLGLAIIFALMMVIPAAISFSAGCEAATAASIIEPAPEDSSGQAEQRYMAGAILLLIVVITMIGWVFIKPIHFPKPEPRYPQPLSRKPKPPLWESHGGNAAVLGMATLLLTFAIVSAAITTLDPAGIDNDNEDTDSIPNPSTRCDREDPPSNATDENAADISQRYNKTSTIIRRPWITDKNATEDIDFTLYLESWDWDDGSITFTVNGSAGIPYEIPFPPIVLVTQHEEAYFLTINIDPASLLTAFWWLEVEVIYEGNPLTTLTYNESNPALNRLNATVLIPPSDGSSKEIEFWYSFQTHYNTTQDFITINIGETMKTTTPLVYEYDINCSGGDYFAVKEHNLTGWVHAIDSNESCLWTNGILSNDHYEISTLSDRNTTLLTKDPSLFRREAFFFYLPGNMLVDMNVGFNLLKVENDNAGILDYSWHFSDEAGHEWTWQIINGEIVSTGISMKYSGTLTVRAEYTIFTGTYDPENPWDGWVKILVGETLVDVDPSYECLDYSNPEKHSENSLNESQLLITIYDESGMPPSSINGQNKLSNVPIQIRSLDGELVFSGETDSSGTTMANLNSDTYDITYGASIGYTVSSSHKLWLMETSQRITIESDQSELSLLCPAVSYNIYSIDGGGGSSLQFDHFDLDLTYEGEQESIKVGPGQSISGEVGFWELETINVPVWYCSITASWDIENPVANIASGCASPNTHQYHEYPFSFNAPTDPGVYTIRLNVCYDFTWPTGYATGWHYSQDMGRDMGVTIVSSELEGPYGVATLIVE